MRDSPVLKYYGGSCKGFYGDGGHRASETEWTMKNSLYWALGPTGAPIRLFPCILGPCRKGEGNPQILRLSRRNFHVSFLKS